MLKYLKYLIAFTLFITAGHATPMEEAIQAFCDHLSSVCPGDRMEKIWHDNFEQVGEPDEFDKMIEKEIFEKYGQNPDDDKK